MGVQHYFLKTSTCYQCLLWKYCSCLEVLHISIKSTRRFKEMPCFTFPLQLFQKTLVPIYWLESFWSSQFVFPALLHLWLLIMKSMDNDKRSWVKQNNDIRNLQSQMLFLTRLNRTVNYTKKQYRVEHFHLSGFQRLNYPENESWVAR